MRIIKPGNGQANSPQMPAPSWLDDLCKQVIKCSELKCGCIVERLPKCITRIAGKSPKILCEIHGFQGVKRDIPFREIIARQTNIAIDDRLIPPF